MQLKPSEEINFKRTESKQKFNYHFWMYEGKTNVIIEVKAERRKKKPW